MNRETILAAALPALLGMALSFAPGASVQAAGPDAPQMAQADKKHKVVFQVSEADPKKWNLALNNAKNVQADLGKDQVAVEIVVYGPGIAMLKLDSEVGNRIEEAVANGVEVVACENTMKGQKLSKDDMLSKIGYVPAGVVELMQRQQQGYAYVRP
jgi:intracellular sulfur oxidation DsrE/DsrF family protein